MVNMPTEVWPPGPGPGETTTGNLGSQPPRLRPWPALHPAGNRIRWTSGRRLRLDRGQRFQAHHAGYPDGTTMGEKGGRAWR